MNCLEIPLDIAGVKIEGVEFTEQGEIFVTITSTIAGTACHVCGQKITDFYGQDREIILRHLSILGKPTYLKIRPERYRCLHCKAHPTTTQKLPWYESRSPQTHAYENHILLSLVNSTVTDVSIKEGIGYEAVMGIIERHVSPEVDWSEFEDLEIIGVDEIALKKGHRDFVTIISVHLRNGKNRVLGVLEDRKKETVRKFFRSIPKNLRKTVRVFCTDLYAGFISAAKEFFGRKVRIVADRFHVAKLYRKGLDDLRKKEMKRLKKALPKAEYKSFKTVMWVLRKNVDDLTEADIEVIKKLKPHAPELVVAYLLCVTLTKIFENRITKEQARSQLRGWKGLVRESGIECFDSFLNTLKERMEEITNYFVERQSSGFVEGLNNKIKVIKRRCYGILNRGHFFQRLFIDLRGYELFA
jgi:transposase